MVERSPDPAISPDGTRLAVCRLDPDAGTRDIWIYDIARGSWSRLSFNPADEIRPAWSPEGNRILFAALRNGYFNLFVRHIQEGTDEELLESVPPSKFPVAFTMDSRSVVFKDGCRKDCGFFRSAGSRSRRRPPATVQDIYVTSFPKRGRTWKVSSGGGIEPKWRRDGKELFYLAGDGRLMAMDIDTAQGFRVGSPRPLFQTPLSFPVQNSPEVRKQYDVTPDGQRFLLNVPLGDTPITVVLNWTAALR